MVYKHHCKLYMIVELEEKILPILPTFGLVIFKITKSTRA
jgi:hypothetical protein